ncbi:NADH dehydrogenase [ubiquinone] 1 alpha subcomplex subunit 2 [Heterodontus francisci]|uniref:NADH dehydrogenase [ubiquinone] 1 alpha subcomplex subunit 2 n=1 Tax=Heterodontus francisci TaxID=7792 RepID=UPI00355BD343
MATVAGSVVRGIGSKLSLNLRELRIHLCQSSAASKGTRDFIEQHYVALKKANPEFPILIRECAGVQSKAWARYEFGKEQNVLLDNLNTEQVAKALESLITKP